MVQRWQLEQSSLGKGTYEVVKSSPTTCDSARGAMARSLHLMIRSQEMIFRSQVLLIATREVLGKLGAE